LPPTAFIDKYLPNNFILYVPKDIVAGDFYWAENQGDLFFIAAADSTGHGVPGAMVSVVCSNALNRSVKEFKLTEPGKILDKTRELVLETFGKSVSEVKDGMDISLLCVDFKQKLLSWSGANNPLWMIKEDNGAPQLIEIKGDKQPIGKTDDPRPFTTHHIPYQENTTFYLFTDGLADQFGLSAETKAKAEGIINNPESSKEEINSAKASLIKGKKYKYKPFASLLLENNQLPLEAQKNAIATSFMNWKGDLEQVDDVCVIGIRI
jgi:serine phosphatase RsbU (regulator of sigma subunit)